MHTVRFSRSGEKCNATTDQTILSVADEHGISFTRGCKNGACNLCICKVREGIENLVHARTGKPFANPEKVMACIAKIKGDIEVLEPKTFKEIPVE